MIAWVRTEVNDEEMTISLLIGEQPIATLSYEAAAKLRNELNAGLSMLKKNNMKDDSLELELGKGITVEVPTEPGTDR